MKSPRKTPPRKQLRENPPRSSPAPQSSGILLGIECGGTRTVALASDPSFKNFTRADAGPCNLRLVTDSELEARFREVTHSLPHPAALGVGMAGVRDSADCARIERVLERIWPGVPRRVDHDLESALAAAEMDASGPAAAARVIVLSGTGSCCYGRSQSGNMAKVGGWGHHLGDRGSAYDIARMALRFMARDFDHSRRLGDFGRSALRQLSLNEPNDLIAWFQSASKAEVAALAPLVFSAARRDPSAAAALKIAQEELVADALACAASLAAPRNPVEFVFAGGVLRQQPAFARRVGEAILASRRGSFRPLNRESVWGAVRMAGQALERADRPARQADPGGRKRAPDGAAIPISTQTSPTEARHERSRDLDRLPVEAAIDLMLDEDARIPTALRAHRSQLARLIRMTVKALKSGGRLLYVGAGTSGRLGVLDASECPPTFRTPPEWVQGIIAGGERALHTSVEGAEDDWAAGARAIEFRQTGPRDVVVGLAASGRTPFVWGALSAARRARARTALICFNPYLRFAPGQKPEVVIAANVGPETLTGSTRLKAGTATKLLLNILTTLTMVRLGKVVGNLMVDLNPSNAKLRDRAVSIVRELTGCDEAEALAALQAADWAVKGAVARVSRGAANPSSRKKGRRRQPGRD